ncbi:RNA binding protein [Reticulomyxa filosa]|uniref:RNA binding protein n=1 Tax=Reticulomyxa filosa TaxID=46433 RepID=X6P733_RETFI|nr:RNA binding protein [Reticulomyxa filosa]|eukprot:ETO34011.1 RNA binding protein [Reticulomyxa filosa]
MSSMVTSFSTLCQDKYGFRTLLKLVNIVTTLEKEHEKKRKGKEKPSQELDSLRLKRALLNELCANDEILNKCSCNLYGNLVVQQLMQNMPKEWLSLITRKLSGKLYGYCVDPFGSHVVQTIMDCYDNDAQRSDIYDEVLSKIVGLSTNVRGNYVVQKMLTLCQSPNVLERISKLFSNHIKVLCCHKISSNVVQLALRSLPAPYRNVIIASICQDSKSYSNSFLATSKKIPFSAQLTTHQYGNYVLQTALEVCSQETHEKLVKLILPHISEADLPRFPWGKKLRKKLHMYDQVIEGKESIHLHPALISPTTSSLDNTNTPNLL